jgi:FdhD protein
VNPIDAPLRPVGVLTAQVTVRRDGRSHTQSDWLAREVPVALVVNGISFAVMLASPDDLEDFALGFALTEGVLDSPTQLYGVEVVEQGSDGIELRLQVAAACEWRLKEHKRTLAGRTGCGLCGVESLAQVRRRPPPATRTPSPALRVQPQALGHAQRALQEAQAVQHLTGASHAAAWCGLDGTVHLVREDIGRHNALDKLIGAMRRAAHDPAAGFVCITSRASFEMVQKAAAVGIGTLAAVSAPTALAVQTAQASGLALAGFVRGDDFVAYTHPERFGLCPTPGSSP